MSDVLSQQINKPDGRKKKGKLNVPADHAYASLNGEFVQLHDTWPDRLLVILFKNAHGFERGDVLHVPHGSIDFDK
jgi:hypothetical protein